MAKVFGKPGEEWGDQQLYNILEELPDDFRVYTQPLLVHKEKRRDPDYVIVHRKAGVIVLEVKDWISITSVHPKYAMVQRRSGDTPEKETSPVEQARKAAFLLSDMLQEDEDLCNWSGKLDFPYRYAGVLPHMPPTVVKRLEKVWGETFVFGRDDLAPELLSKKLLIISIPFNYKKEMSYKQLRAACAIIDRELKVMDPVNKKFRGVYDETQEEISKEPLNFAQNNATKAESRQTDLFSSNDMVDPEKRINHLEREMPPDIADLKSNANIRLLRGFAGTGKTDVLVLRANYLHNNYEDIYILVTTFNKPIIEKRLPPELAHLERVDVINFDKLCAEIHRIRTGKLSSAQTARGVLKNMAKSNPHIAEWGVEFLCDEFQWMKEIGRATRDDYINNIREGRGGVKGKILSQQMKSAVYDIFEEYQKELSYIPAHDWADRRNTTLEFLKSGTEPNKKYDVILVDEAQHFAPNWMNILYYFLYPNASLFICDDPSQSVYRFFSWKQKGVEVVGRTRWLRIPYRNTRQIFTAAYSLIADDVFAQRLLSEDEAEKLELIDSYELRIGPKPKVCRFSNISAEVDFIKNKVNALMDEGILPKEIGVLHTQNFVINKYHRELPRGVNVFEARRQTGLEYPIVFIPQVQKLFDRDTDLSWDEDVSRQRMLTYMMMSRACTDLYLSYQQTWPKNLDPLKEHVNWCEEADLI
jgi:hypothetical protein